MSRSESPLIFRDRLVYGKQAGVELELLERVLGSSSTILPTSSVSDSTEYTDADEIERSSTSHWSCEYSDNDEMEHLLPSTDSSSSSFLGSSSTLGLCLVRGSVRGSGPGGISFNRREGLGCSAISRKLLELFRLGSNRDRPGEVDRSADISSSSGTRSLWAEWWRQQFHFDSRPRVCGWLERPEER